MELLGRGIRLRIIERRLQMIKLCGAWELTDEEAKALRNWLHDARVRMRQDMTQIPKVMCEILRGLEDCIPNG
jgi:hypothetical protein